MAKRKQVRKNQMVATSTERRPYIITSVVIPLFVIALFAVVHYRTGITYYVKSLLMPSVLPSVETKRHDARNVFLMEKHNDNVFGIDVSHYQGNIRWDDVFTINNRFPVDFVFVRASMGASAQDRLFDKNWKAVKRVAKLRGAYHYYRPNENSARQANNFIRTVRLEPGDLPPVLDIEERPRHQSMDSLTVGLRRWLQIVEAHYGVQPILYSGDSYYTDFLEKEFSGYKLWIANYNFWIEKPKKHWHFWQFSEKGTVEGIDTPVDLNMFVGDIIDLEKLALPYR